MVGAGGRIFRVFQLRLGWMFKGGLVSVQKGGLVSVSGKVGRMEFLSDLEGAGTGLEIFSFGNIYFK